MRRNETYANLSWPVYILFVAIGCLFAKILFDGLGINTSYNWSIPIMVYDILLILYGIVTCILVYIIGKIIFSKIAGFDILFVNLGIIGFKKDHGKFKVYWGGKENYSCKVEIVPNKDKKQNVTLAFFGGTIALGVATAITYTLIFTLQTSVTTKCFFILSSIFYLFSFIGYMIPVRLDNMNDGFKFHLIRKYKLEEAYLRNQRNLQALYDETKEIEFYDYGDNNDPISMEGKVYNYFYAIRHFEDKELLKKTVKALSDDYKFVVGEEFVTIGLIAHIFDMCLDGKFDELKEYFWKLDITTRKTIINKKNLDSYKAGLYIEGKIEDSREGLSELVNSLNLAKEKYHYPAQKVAEVKFIENIINDIYTSNPELKL